MAGVGDLDAFFADSIREFEVGELRRRHLDAEERERVLTENLGPPSSPHPDEPFVAGDSKAGVTARSCWFRGRRIHFATIVSVAVGAHHEAEKLRYWIDINCTLKRSFRITLPTILDADHLLVALSKFFSLKIVPTVEEEAAEARKLEEAAIARETNADLRQRRMEALAHKQQELLKDLILVESAPRVSIGFLF
jgi:hypothetical protein